MKMSTRPLRGLLRRKRKQPPQAQFVVAVALSRHGVNDAMPIAADTLESLARAGFALVDAATLNEYRELYGDVVVDTLITGAGR